MLIFHQRYLTKKMSKMFLIRITKSAVNNMRWCCILTIVANSLKAKLVVQYVQISTKVIITLLAWKKEGKLMLIAIQQIINCIMQIAK